MDANPQEAVTPVTDIPPVNPEFKEAKLKVISVQKIKSPLENGLEEQLSIEYELIVAGNTPEDEAQVLQRNTVNFPVEFTEDQLKQELTSVITSINLERKKEFDQVQAAQTEVMPSLVGQEF